MKTCTSKNFSLIVREGITKLASAYDLLNTTIVLPGTREEIALPLRAKKRKLTRDDLVSYFGVEQLELQEAAVADVLGSLAEAARTWVPILQASFLPEDLKAEYGRLLQARLSELFAV
jgi:serine/threonine-protein kinase HipA